MSRSQELIYRDGSTECLGFVAYPGELTHSKPCVLIVHDWGGRSNSFCDKALQLAEMGYIGFAVDMYGNGKLGETKEEKRVLMTPFRQDRNLLLDRISAAFHFASELKEVDATKIAAIGYCFGGLCVLDLARSGVDLKGAVSFHGVLSASQEVNNPSILAKILVLHGYDDTIILPQDVYQFAKEMNEKNADWQIEMYGLTSHSFTDPTANDSEMGLHYNSVTDHRSWKSTESFLQDIFS